MAAPKGHARYGGRQKGTVNKSSAPVEAMAKRLDIDPLEILFLFAKGDWKALGYDSPLLTIGIQDGKPIKKPVIEPMHRISAAKEAAKYLYPQRKALEVSDPQGSGIALIIKDYTSK